MWGPGSFFLAALGGLADVSGNILVSWAGRLGDTIPRCIAVGSFQSSWHALMVGAYPSY